MDDPTRAKPKRKGNYKAGPGRPPGRKNNATLAIEEAARKAADAIDAAFDGDAHAFLQAVYRNPAMPLEIRIMAAGRALRVEAGSFNGLGDIPIQGRLAHRRTDAYGGLLSQRLASVSNPMNVASCCRNIAMP